MWYAASNTDSTRIVPININNLSSVGQKRCYLGYRPEKELIKFSKVRVGLELAVSNGTAVESHAL